MLELNDRGWKVFYIHQIFTTENKNGVLQVPTGSIINKNDLLIGRIPRVTVTSQNNGVYGYYKHNSHTRVFENFISVSFLGNAFYHPYIATLDMKVHCLKLKNKRLSKHLSKFLITSLNQNIHHHTYGDQLSSTDLPKKKLVLPVNELGDPDYEFMEQYIKEREEQLIQKYKQYIGKNIQRGGVLDKVEWRAFILTEIFTHIRRGKRLKKENHSIGNMPYVSSSALCNGIDNFISNTDRVRIFSDCITLANSGSVGSCYYHPYSFVASDHVTSLHNPKFNKCHYLFLAAILCRLSEKYNFNREINDTRVSREKIMLPVDEQGNPNYDIMEQCGKYLMLKKYRQYLDYLDAKRSADD